ncbi:MAG: hypothetical protein HYV96_12640 [Opitutae bacterium]|nr:hypothetical protein [Opitutae bacterium]
MSSSTFAPTPTKDFDTENSRQLHQLESDLLVAERQLDAAQALASALTTRAAARQLAAETAQDSSLAALANLAAARTTAQSVTLAIPLTVDAAARAVEISAKVQPVVEFAHQTAELMLDAINAINKVGLEVKRRMGKNDLISSVVVNGGAQAQTDAANALNAVILALQNTILAFAAAQEASYAAQRVQHSAQRLGTLLAPAEDPITQLAPADGVSPTPPGPVDTIGGLSSMLGKESLGIVAVLEALVQVAQTNAKEQRDLSAQATSDLHAATFALSRATTEAQAATAALSAATAAVVNPDVL